MAEDGYWNKSLIHKMGLSKKIRKKIDAMRGKAGDVDQSLPAVMDHRDDG